MIFKYLNMAHQVDRRAHMESILSGFRHERVEPVKVSWPCGFISTAAHSNWLSHERLIASAATLDDDLIILEDDVSVDFERLKHELDTAKKQDFDLLYFYGTWERACTPVRTTGIIGVYGYHVPKHKAARLAAHLAAGRAQIARTRRNAMMEFIDPWLIQHVQNNPEYTSLSTRSCVFTHREYFCKSDNDLNGHFFPMRQLLIDDGLSWLFCFDKKAAILHGRKGGIQTANYSLHYRNRANGYVQLQDNWKSVRLRIERFATLFWGGTRIRLAEERDLNGWCEKFKRSPRIREELLACSQQ